MTQLISPDEFKIRYGAAIPTQWIWRKEGKVPFQKVGASILYDMSLIDELAFQGKLNKTALLNIMKIKQKDSE